MMQNIAAFLAAHPGLNLATADLFSPEALAQYNWPGNTNRKTLLQSLRIRQRMLKVYPDENVAAVLETLGLHSAHHIASLGENAFTQKVTPSLAVLKDVQAPAALAATIYNKAAGIRRASFELALAQPRTMALVVTDPSGEGTHTDFQQNTPDYQGLFGPMITCDCDSCQSIFGPAAYFTDLMRVITGYITPPFEAQFTLQYRRPDLWSLPLNCTTAETELSYLDIVNAVLLQHLRVNYTGNADPMQVIAGEVYPFTAPFNAALLTIRSAMQELGLPLYALYELLETAAPAAAAEALQLSPEQRQLVTGTRQVALPLLYGFHDTSITDADLCDSLSQQRIFLQQTGLLPEELEALVYQHLDQQQQQAGPLMSMFFLNGVLGDGQYLALRNGDLATREQARLVIVNGTTAGPLTDAMLQQLAVYIRLKKQTSWSYEELDWLLRSCAATMTTTTTSVNDALIEALGQVAAIQDRYAIAADELSAFWYDMKTYGGTKNGQPQDLWDRVYNTPPLMADSASTMEEAYYRPAYGDNPLFTSPPLTWTFKGSGSSQDQRLSNQLAAALDISGTELAAIVNAITTGSYIDLTVEHLSLLYRIARFARMLRMKVEDFIALTGMAGLALTVTDRYWSLEDIATICRQAEWLKKARLTTAQLAYLTTGASQAGLGLPDEQTLGKALSTMTGISASVLVTPALFVSDQVTASGAQALYDQLVATGYITAYGLVTDTRELSADNIYTALAENPALITEVFGGIGIRNFVSFDAGDDGATVIFKFDPFADTTIQHNNSFTMSCWVRPAQTAVPGWDRILGNIPNQENGEQSPSVCQDPDDAGSIRLCYGYGDISYTAYANVFENNTDWVFLTWVNDRGIWRFYRNGILVPFSTGTSPANPQGIYYQPQDPTYYIAPSYAGAVCNVAIWNTVRTADEIQQDMVAYSYENEAGLSVWWPMNEGNGTTIHNNAAADNSTNGQLSGQYSWGVTTSAGAQAEAIAISNILQNMRAAQWAQVAQSLAPVEGVNVGVMAGICSLSSAETAYAANMLIDPEEAASTDGVAYLNVVQFNAALARWFRLTAAEISKIGSYSDKFGGSSFTSGEYVFSVNQLMQLSEYKALQRLCNTVDGLIGYFATAPEQTPTPVLKPTAAQVSLLANLTGWNEAEINAIINSTCFSTVNFNTVAGLGKIAEVMQAESRTGMAMSSLLLLQSLSTVNCFTDPDWSLYDDASAAVNAALSSKKGAQAVTDNNGSIRAQTRDVLCAWLIWNLQTAISGVEQQRELYEYLLIDVNMSPAVKISATVAAMNSLQLYVNRCINGLERGITNNIPKAWWQWMSTYRVWQANREVYLYPENYVDPTLRKFQSTQFRTFISDISKGQITDDNVKQALANYLETVSDVANLELLDACVSTPAAALPGTASANKKNAVFLIGRSRTSPAVFYSRTAVAITSTAGEEEVASLSEATNMQFGPWQQISLQINSDYVSTVAAFGRQFIFWAEQKEIINTNSDNSKYTTIYATIYYSYRDLSGMWVAPTILVKDVLVEIFGSHIGPFDFYTDYLAGARLVNPDTGHEYKYYKGKNWNQVKVQALPATSGSGETILVTLGDYVSCPVSMTEPPDKSTASLTPAAAQYQHMLYAAAKRAYKFKGRYTTIIPAYTLNSAMQTGAWNLNLDTTGATVVDFITLSLKDETGVVFYAGTQTGGGGIHVDHTAPAPDGYWPMVENLQLVEGTTIKSVYTDAAGSFSAVPTILTGTTPRHDALAPVYFNGSLFATIPWGDYLSLTQFTVSCWVYLKGNDGAASDQNLLSMIISWFPPNDTLFSQGGWDMSVRYSQFQFGVGRKGGEYTSNRFGSAQNNQWYFLAFTVNADGYMTATINGQQYALTNAIYCPIPDTPTYSLMIGKDNSSNVKYNSLNGSVANLKIWKEPLTATELLAEYRAMGLWGVTENAAKITRVSNSGAGFLYNEHRQSYIILPDFETEALTEVLHPVYHKSKRVLDLGFSGSPVAADAVVAMRFVRINTNTLPVLMRELSTKGISGLLRPSMQYLKEAKLSLVAPSGNVLLPESNLMNFNGAFSVYFWEIFFYAPYLIAEKLRTSNKYAEAEKWFKYIFDPGSQTGPVGCWPLNNTVNGEFPDLNAGLPATYTGLTPPTSKISVPFAYHQRQVWVFDPALRPTVQVVHSDMLNPSHFTLSAWININSMPVAGAPCTIVNSQGGNNNGYHLYLNYVDSTHCNIVFNIGTASGWVFSRSQDLTAAAIGQWIYISATYNGNHLRIYAYGVDVTSVKGSSKGLIPNKTGTFRIGCGNSSGPGNWFFNGMIADVMVNAYAMTGGEIKRLYKDYKNFGINAAYWNFRPFRRINATSLYHILNGDAWEESFFQPAAYYSASLQMAVYEYDPFDPDTIARLRVNSWQKATFMRYIENLLNWGDSLFTQDTWETLSDATMRYVLAATLLGRSPVKEVSEAPPASVTYQQIADEYGAGNVPPFLIDMENQLSQATAATLEQQVQSILDAYFCIPTNKKLLGYWQLVADRLFKLRHGLTITGAPNNIPLYAPAIDPAALVAASAAGGAANILSASVPSVPWFRFSYMIAQAKSVVSEVSRLGSELLAALEKKDAEQLAQLQAGYQEVIFTLTAQIRASQVNQLQYVGEGLQISYANAAHVRNTYQGWMLEPIGPLEALSLALGEIAIAMNLVMPDFDALAGVAYLIPDIFGLADGGMNFGASTESAGKAIQTFAHVSGMAGQMTAQVAQYVRRELEWNLQRTIANNQMNEIQAQIKANDFALQAARQEAALNQVQLQQSQEVYHFLKTKFTNTELYDWMAGQLSTLYFQMFQLAWSLAQDAQTALQYELNLSQSYLNAASWNASYQGLLAADSLSLALQQMENAYIKGNRRGLEISKTWSMRQHDPQALLTLVSTGSCRFDLSELSYDLDFPGHYNRKIKSLSVTIPAVVGPYQNIHATLVQTGNAVCADANVAAVEYLLGLTDTQPSDGTLRINWNPNQEIILSSGINDAGVFQVNLNDEQYLPFEGTGAVSSWSLDIPQAANAFPLRSISDVIITVNYTAEDGGSAYAAQVAALSPLQNYKGWQYLSMRQLYSAAWFNFCNNPVNGSYALPFELVTQMYPANLDPATLKLCNESGEIGLVPVLQEGYDGTLPQFFFYSDSDLWQASTGLVQVTATAAPQAVPGIGQPWTLYAQNLAGVLVDGKIDQTKLQDIILLIPFSGTLRW